MNPPRLVVLESHPVQYHAPVFKAVQQQGVNVHVVYGSDFSVAGRLDPEFGTTVGWGKGLLDGYDYTVLDPVEKGGPTHAAAVRGEGLASALAALQPDAVLVQGYASPFDRRAVRAALRSQRPVLLRAETTDHAVDRSHVKEAIRDGLLRQLYRRIHRALYIGSRSRGHYERLGVPANRLVFSPYAVDTAPFRTDEGGRSALREHTRSQLGFSSEDRVCVYSGKLSHRKGADVLVEAAALVRAGGLPLALLFVGDGTERAALEATATAAGVPARFTGFQPQGVLSAFYHAADLSALPSRAGETWGLVVNEALHHGVPVVVTDSVGSAPDLVVQGETGETVAPGDANGLAAALTRCALWSGSERVRDRCRRQVAPFSIDAAAKGVVSALESVR